MLKYLGKIGKSMFVLTISLLGVFVYGDSCTTLNGSMLIADDGTYLGILSSNKYDSDSIANRYGSYGGKYSSDSIFNRYGTYGSKYNSDSPWNKYSSDGPLILKDNVVFGRLTLNKYSDGYLNTFNVLLCFLDSDDDRLEPFRDLYESSTSTYIPTTYIPPTSSYSYSTKTPLELCQDQYGINSIVGTEANTCGCKNGYIWSTDRSYCEIKTVYNSCLDTENGYLGIDGNCYCNDGYFRDNDNNKCSKNKSDTEVCESIYGIRSISLGNGLCGCDEGYTINTSSKGLGCISATKSCQIDFGSKSYSEGKGNSDGSYQCYCEDGYEMDTELKNCILSEERTNTRKGLTDDTELNNGISWMYNNGLTMFDTPTTFMSDNGLRRDEATKFFVQYAKEVMGKTPDISKVGCDFTDLSKAWPDLKDLLKESCQLGLFQGYEGKFMPTEQLTNGQVITVFMRLIDGYKDETGSHFAYQYYLAARNLGLLTDLNLSYQENFDLSTTRGEVAKMLYRGKDK